MTTDGIASPRFEPSGFFVLRTPLLPFDEMTAWSQGLEAIGARDDPQRLPSALERDRNVLRSRLRDIVNRAEVRDALFVGSAGVEAALDTWERQPDSEPGGKLEAAVVSYVSRAAARATPFGLFAGCTTGGISASTALRLAPREAYQRHSRLDMDYLWALAESLERDPELRQEFLHEPNSSLYEAAGRLRLAEARLTPNGRSYHLVAVDKDPYLAAVLERAEGGATLEALIEVLVDDEITHAEATEFVDELVTSQILLSDVWPQVTGEEPVHRMIALLSERAATAEMSKTLDEARTALEIIDVEGPGASPERYRAVASILESLPARITPGRLVQVDLVKPALHVTLGGEVLSELTRGVDILRRLVPAQEPEGLTRFREQFTDRYETREMPLVEALDEETGIGFERSESPLAEASPLLAGLPFEGAVPDSERWTARDGLLLAKLTQALAGGAEEISLEEPDLKSLAPERPRPLPDALHVMATVAGESDEAVVRGDFRVLLHSVGGPSGALLLGRFCHADQQLSRFVRAHLQAEEACRPDQVFAEIVHLPEGRIGNILSRPVLRTYEIPYLGRSGAPADHQLPVTDLLVSVRGDRIVLRSARLDREIAPRLTTAHNYGWRSLGLYRFLCALQHQHVAGGLAWDWGPLQEAAFLPRIVTGRLVLSRACWNLSEAELRTVSRARAAEQFTAVQGLRGERGLPRYVALADDDNELVLDLDNALSIDALARQVRGRRRATLVEMFPGPDELCVSGPEGRFVHELIVPFVRKGASQDAPEVTRGVPTSVRRRFPPGSEWLYAKLYTGSSTGDQVLTHVVEPVVRSSMQSGAADAWFFIRYGDPEWHVRLRLHGEPSRLHGVVLPEFQAAAAALVDDGRVWRLQLDTYEREVERYGGDQAIALAEEVFTADSEAVLAILGSSSGDFGLDLRWRLALCGIDRFFDDLGLTLDEKLSVTRQSRKAFEDEFRVGGAFKSEVGRRFRAERRAVEALLGSDEEAPLDLLVAGEPRPNLAAGLAALRRRSTTVAPAMEQLSWLARRDRLSTSVIDIAASLAHMHVNRLLRSSQRAHELVLYEFLDRFYSSRVARRASSP